MPSGKTHNAINLAAIGPVAWVASTQLHSRPLYILLGCAGYLFATFFMSPDLDIGHSCPSRRWKYLAPLWWPYQLFFRHRGFSHNPLIGSLSRLLYLAGCCILVFGFYNMAPLMWKGQDAWRALASIKQPMNENLTDTFASFRLHSHACAAVLLGVWLSDLIHILSDRGASRIKKFFH